MTAATSGESEEEKIMPKSTTAGDAKKRTQVKDLTAPETKMSAEEMKKVKGGLPAVQRMGDGSVRAGDGSVRPEAGQTNIIASDEYFSGK